MATNKTFGRLNGNALTYAPTWLHIGKTIVINPSDDEYASAGWLKIAQSSPSPGDGYHLTGTSYEVRDGQICAVYAYGEDEPEPPPPPRTFSILNFELACFKRGILDKVDEFIDSQVLTNEKNQTIPLRRAYARANDFVEDNPYFSQFYSAGLDYIGYTSEQGEEILAESVVG